jgi:hypothetical protein
MSMIAYAVGLGEIYNFFILINLKLMDLLKGMYGVSHIYALKMAEVLLSCLLVIIIFINIFIY